MKKLNNYGQTLIEALIALGVSIVVIAAIALAVLTAMNNVTFSKNQNLATGYAQQGMDILRQQSESDWTTFDNTCLVTGYPCTYCLDQGAIVLGSDCTSTNINSFFLRKVKIEHLGSGCLTGDKVTVIVSWRDGKCTDASNLYCHNVTLNSCFTEINNVPPL
jgi:type II secretory pathway pseudopilin PulG